MEVKLGYDDAALKSKVSELIKKSYSGGASDSNNQLAHIIDAIEKEEARKAPRSFYLDRLLLSRFDEVRIRNTLRDLIGEGFIREGNTFDPNSDWPWFHLTEKGKAEL